MKSKLILSVLFVSLFFCNELYSQIFFSEFGEEKGLEIEQRWRRSKIFDKNSDAILILKITNTLESALEVKISIGFYKDEMLVFMSEEQEICLEPGQTKRGGKDDLRFLAEEITRADTREENFSWDFAKIEVNEVDSCE
ncbi:MAG: hypothetical protein ACOCWC_00715 [Bacteroidota bacterium]